jgi:hypothetical protein
MNDLPEFRVEPARERWVTVQTWELHARLATHPVTLGEYRLFLTATERPLPPAPAHHDADDREPVVEVSQLDAAAYCDWLGGQEGAVYRLPSLPELHALECLAEDEGFSAQIWPHRRGDLAEMRGGLKRQYLCEWAIDIEDPPISSDRPERQMAGIFYPAWLRPGNSASHLQAHLLASEGYDFVTFRVAWPQGR